MAISFRDLKADEIDVRVSKITAKGLQLLLYKDARVDQNILDETVTPENWQREHKELKQNIYCGVSIWNEDKKMWVTKWDCGKESFSDSEKGEASDSFKRACVNWGIGRELYTAPFVWIAEDACNIEKNDKGKLECKDKFVVEKIAIQDKEIVGLAIRNLKKKDENGNALRVYMWQKKV